MESKKNDLKKIDRIRGWLLLPVVSLFFGIVFSSIGLWGFLMSIDRTAPVGTMTQDGKAIVEIAKYSLKDAGIIWFDGFMLNLILLSFAIVVAIFVLKKKKVAPKLLIIYFVLIPIINLSSMLCTKMLFGSPALPMQILPQSIIILTSIIWSAIWVSYIIISKRVKATFVY